MTIEKPETILEQEKGNLKLEIIQYEGSFFYNLYEKINDKFVHITEGYLKSLDDERTEYLNIPYTDLPKKIWAEVLNPLEDVA